MADEDPTTLRPAPADADLRGVRPYLEVSTGARQGDRVPLQVGSNTVGKGADADIRLEDSGVSRLHARVEVGADGRVLLTDLASTNGTYVGKQRVDTYALEHGDRVHFGPDAVARLVYLRDGAAARATMLSARQLQLARLVAAGMTNAQIAERLRIRPRTVTSHLDHIYTRLDIRNRAALTRWVLERGLDR